MLLRAFTLFLAFGTIVSNAATIGLTDPAETFGDAKNAVATTDNTRNVTITKGGFCDSHPSDEEFARVETEFKALLDSGKSLIPTDNSSFAPGVKTIKVYWHIIYTSNAGYISVNTIIANIAALNNWFPPTLRFELAGVTRTFSPTWFNLASIENFNQWLNMGTLTHQGNAQALNVWSSGMTVSSAIGSARFPWQYQAFPRADGVLLKYNMLSSGKLIVHEVGHWLGLYHTFQGGCAGVGDAVLDTPAEGVPTFGGCPFGKNTCPSPGNDPIRNHMDYSSDPCRIQFTPGQILRMKQQCFAYRGFTF